MGFGLGVPVVRPPVSPLSKTDIQAAALEPRGFGDARIGLKKFTARLNDYHERLENHKASPIEPDHVREILHKLEAKRSLLQQTLAAARKHDKRARVEAKLKVVDAQISRARHLLREFDEPA